MKPCQLQWTNRKGATLTIGRSLRPDRIELVLTDNDGKEKSRRDVDAADHAAVFGLAHSAQLIIDGHAGTNSMVHDVFRQIEPLMD